MLKVALRFGLLAAALLSLILLSQFSYFSQTLPNEVLFSIFAVVDFLSFRGGRKAQSGI